MTLDECLRIARELRLDESNRHPELHYLATPQDLLAFARQVEAEALDKCLHEAKYMAMEIDGITKCKVVSLQTFEERIFALKEESNAG